MATTTASMAGREAQALAEHLRDGALLDFDAGGFKSRGQRFEWFDVIRA